MIQQASMQDLAAWDKIMRGLTMRRYSEVIREFADAYGIAKSTVSRHFIEASRGALDKLSSRALRGFALCAILIDGQYFQQQEVVVALGVTTTGQKIVLGLRQGATENAVVVTQLLEELQDRGVDFDVPRLYVLDGSKALAKAIRHVCGPAALIQRCQVHKKRNVISHLTQEQAAYVRQQLSAAYATVEHADAKRTLDRLLRHLMEINPSAARSLEEGMEDTITVHKLRMTDTLRRSLASTNLIESAFSQVATICRNVKRWSAGDQLLHWVASALIYGEGRWNRLRPQADPAAAQRGGTGD